MTVYLAPAAQGTGDGSSEANADDYNNIDSYIAPGETIILIDSAGAYHRTNTGPSITNGGTAANPCTIGGASSGSKAAFTSTREDPWLGGDEGDIIFQIKAGGDNLIWQNFSLTDLKQGWQIGADVENLVFDEITYDNVRFVIENRITAGETTATISGFTATNISGSKTSKRVIELAYDTHDVVITDVVGDSENTDGDPISMGIHFDDTVHDVVCTRVDMANHYHDAAAYWNGDGFSSEAGTYNFTFIDCDASGSTDAGFDLKTEGLRFLRCRAWDNKRNFRLWGADVELVNCVSAHPNLRGGTGTQADLQTTDSAYVTLSGCVFVDHDTATIVFDVDQTSTVIAGDTDVTRHTSSTLSTVESNATLSADNITDTLDDTPDATVPDAPAGGTISEYASVIAAAVTTPPALGLTMPARIFKPGFILSQFSDTPPRKRVSLMEWVDHADDEDEN